MPDNLCSNSVPVVVSEGCHDMYSVTEIYFSHGSKGWKSKIKVSAELVSSEASLLGLWMAVFSLCPHMAIPSVYICVLISCSYKDIILD